MSDSLGGVPATNPGSRKKLGCLIMAIPAVLFIIVLAIWSPLVKAVTATGSVSSVRLVNTILGGLAFILFIAIPVCVIIGAIKIGKKK